MSSEIRLVQLDLTGLLRAARIDDSVLAQLAGPAEAAFDSARARIASGEIGFAGLADDAALARRALDYAANLDPNIDTMVVIGIGGSSLGPHAVYSALARPFDPVRGRAPGMPRRLFFPDNSDPVTFAGLLDALDLGRTVFNVVTKSGGTAETAAQTMVLVDRIQSQLGKDALAKHLVVTTDPAKGALREVAGRFDLPAFEVPANVGGRFSVLSAVGLVPAAVAGLDVVGLLEGARTMRDAVLGDDARGLESNPALALAALLHHHDRELGRPMVVMMPYADALYDCADWFRQLWAESLGKAQATNGSTVNVGPTPIASRGATDQHSQLQLYAEGPDDKVYLMLSAERRATDLELPAAGIADLGAYGYLAGRRMGELLDAELVGTTSSLRGRGRPTASLRLNEVSAPAVGAFFMLLEAATAFAGPLYGVDPYDQPGVEEAKRLAFGALGRDGYQPPNEEHLASDPRFVFGVGA
jgi:glucose-6-phosphate isomerase